MTENIQGVGQLMARLKAASTPRGLLPTIQIAAVREAKLIVPHRTRNLSRTIRPGHVDLTSATVIAGGRLKVGYAAVVERGSRPHIIRPKAGRRGRNGGQAMLAWGGSRRLSGSLRSGSSPTHFARSVRHPGTRAQPFLVPGLIKAARDNGVEAIVKAWNGAA